MTTPTPTQAELEAAVAIVHYIRNLQTLDSLGPSAKELATILAAHRAAPPATLAPTFNLDPANDDEIARQHNDALNRIGDILIDLQNEAIERARSVFEEQKAAPAHRAAPPDESTLQAACRKLIIYRERVGALNFQLEKADDFINLMRAALDGLPADPAQAQRAVTP